MFCFCLCIDTFGGQPWGLSHYFVPLYHRTTLPVQLVMYCVLKNDHTKPLLLKQASEENKMLQLFRR